MKTGWIKLKSKKKNNIGRRNPYWFLYVLIVIIIFLLILLKLILVKLRCPDFIIFNKINNLTMFSQIISSMMIAMGTFVALYIPFLSKKVEKIDEQEKTKVKLYDILKKIKNIIDYLLKDNSNKNKNPQEDNPNNNENLFSIISSIDFIKQNRDILHYLDFTLRDNKIEDKKNKEIRREMYDLILSNKFAIRIIFLAPTNAGIGFYSLEKNETKFYNPEKNNEIKKDIHKEFKNTIENLRKNNKKKFYYEIIEKFCNELKQNRNNRKSKKE